MQRELLGGESHGHLRGVTRLIHVSSRPPRIMPVAAHLVGVALVHRVGVALRQRQEAGRRPVG